MRVNPTVVPIEDMRYWKTCLDDLRASRTSGFLQLTAIMDGISSRKKGPDGQATTTKISDPVVRGCTMHTAQR